MDMRPSCLNCARKHLAQAEILLHESKQGYRAHYWLSMGHLAEAADELLRDYPEMADTVRNERKLLEEDPDYQIPILDLIEQVSKLDSQSDLGDADEQA